MPSPAQRLAALFHRRWAVPILAELQRDSGAKFVTLAYRLSASQTVVRQTLDELIQRGMVRRNSGYGHPLRPEYLLTRYGERLAPECMTLHDALRKRELCDVGFKKWSMPALFAIGDGARRFVDVVGALEASDRAVALTLKDLSEVALVRRAVVESFPPGSAYSPTRAGAALLPTLERLCA